MRLGASTLRPVFRVVGGPSRAPWRWPLREAKRPPSALWGRQVLVSPGSSLGTNRSQGRGPGWLGPAGSARLSQQGAPHAAGDHSLLGWGQGCGAVRVKPGQVRPSGDQAPPLPGLRITRPVSTPFPPPCSVEGDVGPSGYVCSLGSSCWRQPLFSEGKRQGSGFPRCSLKFQAVPCTKCCGRKGQGRGRQGRGGGGWAWERSWLWLLSFLLLSSSSSSLG